MGDRLGRRKVDQSRKFKEEEGSSCCDVSKVRAQLNTAGSSDANGG